MLKLIEACRLHVVAVLQKNLSTVKSLTHCNLQVSSAPSLSVFPDAMVPPLATEEEEEASTSPSLVNTTLPPSQQQTAVLDNRLVLATSLLQGHLLFLL